MADVVRLHIALADTIERLMWCDCIGCSAATFCAFHANFEVHWTQLYGIHRSNAALSQLMSQLICAALSQTMAICLKQSLSAVKLLQQPPSLGNMAVSCASCSCFAMHASGSAIPYVSTLSADNLCTADVCSSPDDALQHSLYQELYSGRSQQLIVRNAARQDCSAREQGAAFTKQRGASVHFQACCHTPSSFSSLWQRKRGGSMTASLQVAYTLTHLVVL